jgi:TonB family protein
MQLFWVVLALVCVAQQTPATQSPSGDCVSQAVTTVWTPIAPPVVVKRVDPKFPLPQLAKASVWGTVVMDVWIGEDGAVECVKVIRPVPLVDAVAVAAVRQWEFAPAKLGDRPIAVVHRIGIRYPDGTVF